MGTIFLTLARNDAEASPVLGASARSSEATTLAEVKAGPIVEGHALAQLEREQPVAVAVRPARGQVGYQLEFGVVLDELVIDQPQRLEVEEVGDDVRVELLHARSVADDEGAT